MISTAAIEGHWRDSFFGASSWVSDDWAQEQQQPAAKPAKAQSDGATWRWFISKFSKLTKDTDGCDRHFKVLELLFRDAVGMGVGGEGLTNFADILSTICNVQQPLYRLFYGADLLANPKHGADHWGMFKITGVVCPLILVGVSGLQLACNAHKFKIIKLNDYAKWSLWSQKVGLAGAVVAMLFAFQNATFLFVRKGQAVLHKRQVLPQIQQDEQAVKEIDAGIAKLGSDGWNNVIAGTKYFFDAAKLCVGLYANNRGIWALKYVAAGLAVTQTWHTLKHCEH